ncbi:hypothetical protein [Paenibacillus sp. NPDC058071]|uniref:hypothetical protein n=1 Tax=Paenibacillus sp. NPDC058071 TaxID=3346326 RepID=UPI0036D9EF0D
MAKKIGSFATEQQVIDAVAALQQAGFETGELKIIAKDAEHSRRIERESGMHVDETRELSETLEHIDSDGDTWVPPVVFAGGLMSTAGWNAVPFGIVSSSVDDGVLGALDALGLDTQESHLCGEVIRAGQTVVVVETDESKSLLDKDGGPDLSRLGVAEGIFRECGASRIFPGS